MNTNSEETVERLFKTILLGDNQVGKTSIQLRYLNELIKWYYTQTIAPDFRTKVFNDLDGEQIRLQIWDLSSRTEWISNIYYKGANGVIILFDITCRKSFEHCEEYWFKEVNQKVPSTNIANRQHEKKPVIYLVGTKSDLDINRQVSYAEASQLASEYNCKYFEVSAKENINIDGMFLELAKTMVSIDKLHLSGENETNLPVINNNTIVNFKKFIIVIFKVIIIFIVVKGSQNLKLFEK